VGLKLINNETNGVKNYEINGTFLTRFSYICYLQKYNIYFLKYCSSQSNNSELQRQRSKNLQRREWTSAFEKKNIFFYKCTLEKTL
jgi:hypothetical protein